MLKVQDLHVYYGAIHAVKGVSLEVADGEIVTLIGANGAGKSTVLNTISGLLKPKSGTVEFMGEMIGSMPPNKVVQHGLVQCPEGRRIFARMTVEENLQMGAYTRPSSELAQNLEKVYELFPRLKERQKQVGGTLSGGEQQMLAMGRAMMSQPKLLMLDEPSMGLAPLLVEQIFGIITAQGRNDHSAGRAERADGASGRGPGLCSGIRCDHAFWPRARTSRKRFDQESLSWRIKANIL